MATNGITSGKAPRRRGKSPIREAGVPMYVGDALLEKANGDMGRLQFAQQQPMTGLSVATTDRLLRKAGINLKQGS